jgi:hypothetical protein
VSQPGGPTGRVVFDYPESASATSDGKILLSKNADDSYFSSWQLTPGANGLPLVKVSGTLVDVASGTPKAGTVYLRIDDPPDPAPYRGTDAVVGDNDPAYLRATFVGTTPPASGTSLQTDSSGRFEARLELPGRTAGDNYQVTGTASQLFSCSAGAPCTKSGIFTMWKRIYVEEEHMFRSGAFIRNVARGGGDLIPIDDPAPFRSLAPDISQLELVHGDAGDGQGFYFDFVTFHALEQDPSGWFIRTKGTLPREYGVTPSQSPTAIAGALRDGVGVAAAGTYDADSRYIRPLFDSAYTDFKPVSRLAVAEVPHIQEISLLNGLFYAAHWLQTGPTQSSVPPLPERRRTDPNVFHRIVASTTPLVPEPQHNNALGAELGVTAVNAGTNFSFILAQRIEELTSTLLPDRNVPGLFVGREYFGLSAFLVNSEVTAHETVHLWVHSGASDAKGHCIQERWQHTTPRLNCLMHKPYGLNNDNAGLADGIVDLHYENHGADSEYMTIRRAADPVPLQ